MVTVGLSLKVIAMWQRRTLHECADELLQISERFRFHWKSHYRYDKSLPARNPILIEASTQGVEILRTLSLAIRSEQDYGLIPRDRTIVGTVRESVTRDDWEQLVSSYRPPYCELSDFKPLRLREALNKIAHANPSRASFFADKNDHDLILAGERGMGTWYAVISIIDLCKCIKSLPDSTIEGELCEART